MLTSDAHDLHGINFEEGYIAVVDKPLRWTSADVVRKVKFTLRKLGYRRIKVGHAGTLDPLATGILLVCIGRATKMADALQAEEKEYMADVMLGATVDLGVAALTAITVCLGHGQAVHARGCEGFLDIVEFMGLDDSGNELHLTSPP